MKQINPLNAELNPICHLLALLGDHHILHVSRIRVKMVRIKQFGVTTNLYTVALHLSGIIGTAIHPDM